jgi:8-oxo-dGTP diphosphatase
MDRHITDVVAAVIKREDGKVLIARRGKGHAFADLWEFPGGKMEAGETAEQALAREIKEELDTDIDVGRLIHDWKYRYDFGNIRFLAFESKIVNNRQPRNLEHSELSWVGISELNRFVFVPADNELVSVLEDFYL